MVEFNLTVNAFVFLFRVEFKYSIAIVGKFELNVAVVGNPLTVNPDVEFRGDVAFDIGEDECLLKVSFVSVATNPPALGRLTMMRGCLQTPLTSMVCVSASSFCTEMVPLYEPGLCGLNVTVTVPLSFSVFLST